MILNNAKIVACPFCGKKKNYFPSFQETPLDLFYGQIFNEETATKFKTQYKAAKKNKGELDGL